MEYLRRNLSRIRENKYVVGEFSDFILIFINGYIKDFVK